MINQRVGPQAPLPILRAALVAGVVLFGVVIVFVHRNGSFATAPQPAAMGYAQLAVAVGALVAAFVLRPRIASEPDVAKRASLLLTGWAIGEGAALFGGVIFMLSGDYKPYAIGLLAMACSLVLLPIRNSSTRG